MKVYVLLFFTILFVQTSASFYGQLRGAMSNVEWGFGKLLNDVFYVKDTLHCTISAVEEVLAMNGLLEQTSDFNNKCPGYVKPKILPKPRENRHRSYFEKHFEYNQPSRHFSSEAELEHISQELESSILNVNKSINDILRKRDANRNFKVISELLKDETDRLHAVSEILGRELENISINVRNEIKKLHIGHRNPGDTIWEDLKALHDLKGKSNNKTEINEINNIIDRVVSELHVIPNKKVLTEDEKLEEIKKQLDKYESEKQNDRNPVFNTKQTTQNKISQKKEIKSFKDLAQNIMIKDNMLIADNDIGQVFKRETTSQGAHTETSLFAADIATLDSSSPFYNPNPIADSNKIVEDAKSIMEESKKSEQLLNNFFKEHQQSNTDVFSNADMFNFG